MEILDKSKLRNLLLPTCRMMSGRTGHGFDIQIDRVKNELWLEILSGNLVISKMQLLEMITNETGFYIKGMFEGYSIEEIKKSWDEFSEWKNLTTAVQ